MSEIAIDELIRKVGSTYKLVVLAARRAIELSEGAAVLVAAPADTKLSTLALREIQEDKITMKAEE